MVDASPSAAIAVAASVATVSLALYVVKLRAELGAFAGKKTVKTTTKTSTTARNAQGERLWTAEELIATRRSIYPESYDPTRKVPRVIVERMLEAANWAPTHSRTEPWRFVVFESEEARVALGQLQADIYKKMVPADRFLQKKYNKAIESKKQSSYVIAICMQRQKSEKLPEVEEVCAVACAVQNMHLVATAHGVGAYWSSGPPIMSQDMKDFLKLGAKDQCLGLFYVGHPTGSHPDGARKPIAEKVQWIGH